MSKHILLVHDLAGYGKVSLSAMMPVLSHMGHHLYTLPTALVSNTLDYGKFYIQETTEYMRQSLKVWAELGFSFDVVSTGMILSAEQAALVSDFCEQSAKKGALVFVDPIMGDEGKLYNGVGEETVAHMRKMVAVADCIVPNYTEAAYLADMPYHEGNEQLFCALAEINALYVSPCAPCQRLHSHFAGGYLFVPHICAGEHLRTAVSFIRVERLSLRDAFACCLCDGEFRIRVRQ